MSKFSNIYVWAAELIDKGFSTQDALRTISRSPLADRRFVPLTVIDDTDSPYTATEDDIYIDADATSGAITVNLPAGQDGRIYNIKNSSSAGANIVTVVPNGSDTIDGSATFPLNPTPTRESITIIYSATATDWRIV